MLANLWAAIGARGLTQLELCFEFKIVPQTLTHIIRGRIQADPELRRKIAARLDADEAWLFMPTKIIPSRRPAGGDTAHAAA